MIGGLLILLGVLLWLLGGYFIVGIILIVFGVVLLFAPGPWYGYHHYRDRRPPP